jgi:hypothetical protein
VAVQLEHHGDQSHLKAKLIECAITTATHSERETFLSDQRLEQAITKSRGGGAAGYTDLLNRAILPASEVERLDLTYSQYLISEPICIQQFPGETRRPRRVPPQRAEAPRQRLPHPDLVQFSLAEPPRQLEDGVFFKRPSAGLKRWGWLATHEPMLEIDLLTASMLREQMSRSFPDCSLEVRVTNGRWLVHLAGAMAVTTNWLDTLESPSLERCDEIRRQLQSRFRKHEPSLLDEFFIAVVGREIQVPNPERLSEAAVDVALQKFNRIVRSRGTQFLIAASPDFPSQQKHKAADLERQPWESGFTSTTHDKPYAEYLLALPMPAGKSSKRDALAIVLNELLGQQQTNYWFQLLRSRGLSYSLTPSLVLDQSVLVLQFVCPQPIADLIPKRYPLGLPDMVSAQNAAAHRLAQKLAHGDPGSWSKFAQNVNWAHDISREIRALNREDVECALSESCKSVRVMARLPAH